MGNFSAGSAILAVAALGASGSLWASAPPGPAPGRAANTSVVVAEASPLKRVDGNPKVMRVSATAPQVKRDAASFDANHAASPSGPSEPRQPDTALMLMASLGIMGTVVFRVSKR